MALSKVNPSLVQNFGRRRLNINGAMQVSQRATSATISDGANEGYRTLDRWRTLFSSSAGGVATMSQVNGGPNFKFANSLKVDVTTADTSLDANHAITLQYKFEDQDIANSGWEYRDPNSKLNVSFWAKSTKAGTYCVFLYSLNNTSYNIVKEYTLAADTWTYVSLSFKGSNNQIAFDNDNSGGLIVGWTLAAGSNRYENVVEGEWILSSSGQGQGRYATSNQVNFFDSTSNVYEFTGVQIEVGDTATDFEHRSYAEELSLCQRYFEKDNINGGSGTHRISINKGTTTSNYYFAVPYKVTKRALPTVTISQLYDSDLTISTHAAANTDSHLGLKNATGGSTNTRALAEINWSVDSEI
jgi:hypothetical protein